MRTQQPMALCRAREGRNRSVPASNIRHDGSNGESTRCEGQDRRIHGAQTKTFSVAHIYGG